MQKIYFKDKLIAEAAQGDDVNEVINKYIAEAEAEILPILNKIKVLEAMIDNVYPKRSKDTEQEYLAFLRKVNPEFIEALEDIGVSAFGNNFSGLYIIAPNTVGALLEYRTKENYTDKVSPAVLRTRLKNQIPNRRFIEIVEE